LRSAIGERRSGFQPIRTWREPVPFRRAPWRRFAGHDAGPAHAALYSPLCASRRRRRGSCVSGRGSPSRAGVVRHFPHLPLDFQAKKADNSDAKVGPGGGLRLKSLCENEQGTPEPVPMFPIGMRAVGVPVKDPALAAEGPGLSA
jgi:hypothetical protein